MLSPISYIIPPLDFSYPPPLKRQTFIFVTLNKFNNKLTNKNFGVKTFINKIKINT